MESVKTNEEELTSTMGSLLSTSKDEKSDASDSTPTSSTDAFTTTLTSHIAADDPISSTSSDVLDSKRTNKTNDVSQSSSHNVVNANPIMSSIRNMSIGDHMSIVSEKDLLDMNITDTSTEKITENVDDIVQDLENLLGEPTTTFDFTIRSKETSRCFSSTSQHKDISMDLDDFSMDFQIPEEQPKGTTVDPVSDEANRTADIQNNQIEDVNKVICQDARENNFSSCFTDDSVNQSEVTSAPVHIQVNVETPLGDNQDTNASRDNFDDVKSNLESVSRQHDENNSENIVETCREETSEGNENLEGTDITTTGFKETEKIHQVEEHENNVQLEEIKEQHQDENLQVLTNAADANEVEHVEEKIRDDHGSSDSNNSCTAEATENISDVKSESTHLQTSNIAKEEKENEDENVTNLTCSGSQKLEEHNKHQEELRHQEKLDVEEVSMHSSNTQDATLEETQPQEQFSPLATMEHVTVEEKQVHENLSLETSTRHEEKQDSEKEMLPFSNVQDVEMEEKGDQEKPGGKQDSKEEVSPLSIAQDVEMEEKEEKGENGKTEEKQQSEEVSILNNAHDVETEGKGDQEKTEEQQDSDEMPILSNVQDVEKEENEDSKEEVAILSNVQDVNVEEKGDQEIPEEKQHSKEEVSILSNAQDVDIEEKAHQNKIIPQITISQFEETEEKQDEVDESSDLTSCSREVQIEVEEKPAEESSLRTALQLEEVKEEQDEAKDLTESQDLEVEEKGEQDLPSHSDSSEKVEDSKVENVDATLQDTVENIPTEEKNADTESVIEILPPEPQGEGYLSNLSNVGDVIEPLIESVSTKNEEMIQNEGTEKTEVMEELVNSEKTDIFPITEDEGQQVLGSSRDTEVEKPVTSEMCDTIVEESMQVDETKEDANLPITETVQEVANAESVEMKESPENEVAVQLEPEDVANTSEIAEHHGASIIVPNEQNEKSCLSNEINKSQDTSTKTMDEEQISQTQKIDNVVEPTVVTKEVVDVQPVASSGLHIQQGEEVCQISTIPVETESIDQILSTEEEIRVSQSMEVPQIEEPTISTKQDVNSEECTEISSMTQEGDLQNSKINIPDDSDDIPSVIQVDSDTPKGNIIDSVQSTSVPIEDVTALDVLNENIVISSCISSESLDIFNGSAVGVSTEAAQSTVDDAMEVPPVVSVDELNMLPSFMDTSANLQDHMVEGDADVPTSSTESVKNLEEAVIENSILPLVMEDVPDLDVLNAISTLDDNKQDFIPEMADNLESSDTLLASNAFTNEEQRNIDSVPFESCIDSSLPTVDEIFAEQSDQPPVDLPDDNLETLLAVASLQGVCETDGAYNMQPVDDLTSYVAEEPSMKIQDDKIESLFEHKQTVEEVQPLTELEAGNEAVERIVEEVGSVQPEQVQNEDIKLKEPLIINVDDSEKDRAYSPKIIIKPIKPSEEEEGEVSSASGEPDEKEGSKGSLKMTITKQSDTMHSILKIYDPDNDGSQDQDPEDLQPEPTVPKLIIKPIVQPNEQPHSPKMSTRSSKQVFSPSSSGSQRSASPRITIKPIVKPDNLSESVGPVKITIKPVLKPEEGHRQKHSPKLTIKPIVKPDEESSPEAKVHSPRVTIKPIVKPPEEVEQVSSPRITIKPIVKPETTPEPVSSTPRVTIKPVVKPVEKEKVAESPEPVERSSPKITIKPIVKPQEPEVQLEDFEESIKERIVLKINKGNIPGSSKELRKREAPQEEEKSERLAKIKLKFSKGGGHPHIVQNESPNKRSLEQSEHDKFKRQRIDTESLLPGVTITPIPKIKEMLSNKISDKVVTVEDDDDDVTIIEDSLTNKPSPIVISEESNQDSINAADMRDPISDIPVFEITPDCVKTINPQSVTPIVEVPVTLPAPRKRGRPRKVPLQVREDFKDPKEEEPKPVVESTRPKRSCRGQSVRTTLGIKPRKPRGPGRGRGGKRGMGTRSTPTPPETPPKPAKEPKLSAAKLKQLKEDLIVVTDKTEVKIEIDDGLHKSPSQSLLAPPQTDNSTTDRADIVMYEEETRMSAETSSRAQTPAKQVVSSTPSVDLVEESQSSVQSTATTESAKVRKGPRLEVHQEPEGAVISADQLAEYYWSGGGPFMLQEQVAQFLGIKSFKRKYPNIPRRVVDMQERDFIRESGLAGEAMCDLGLTAVNSTDILDIMYSDFQDKYEEYCKHQRDRQAKDLTNKQKALSLAASQEKTKIDITQQAVQSAATWNATFNKARRDQRKACMDLQTLTVHFPKGKMKQINKPKLGHYPVALVPGQFTDYYAEFTPTEINNLPLNTLCYEPVIRGGAQEMECDSQTDGSGSESDSSTSDSDTSYSGSSDGEDCTLCNKPTMKRVAAAQ